LSILVVGSVALDSIETPKGKIEETPGGAAIYFSIAASLFTKIRVVGVIGSDFPSEYITLLEERGVDLRGLERREGKTFRWSGKYDASLSEVKTLDTQLNLFESFRSSLPPEYRETKVVFLANIDPELQMQVLAQVRNPKFVACDTMNFWIRRKRESLLSTLEKVHLVLMNDSEIRELFDEYNLIKAAWKLLSIGPKWVVVKKGEHGALLISNSTCFPLPAYPLDEVCDPTGAGDSFAGGLLGYLSRSDGFTSIEEMKKALVFGTIIASFTIEGFGLSRLKLISLKDVEKRYREFKKSTHFDGV
jgi:sugar/nucleoside kinase (ribokinase family)